MINVCVHRFPCTSCEESESANCKQGDDIVDPVLTEEAVAMEAGRVAIDIEGENKIITNIEMHYFPWVQPGTLVQFEKETEIVNCKVDSYKISVRKSNNDFSVQTSLTTQRLE